jgi:hypothetical protein
MENTIVAHDRSALFTHLWYLAQKDSNEFVYFKGLTDEERQNVMNLITDVLDVERRQIVGERLKPVISEPIPTTQQVPVVPASTTLPLHDPSQDSFGKGELWIPWAQRFAAGPKRGEYPRKYPSGLIVHWTAGHRNGLKAGMDFMRTSGMLYLMVDKDGNLGQSDPLNFHGYHAGNSSHPSVKGYVSDDFAGVELQAAGNLRANGGHYYPWWDNGKLDPKNRIPHEEVITVSARDNISAGHYHLYTLPQMLALRKLVAWLHLNNPDVFSIDRVLGHDEVSPGRKSDPGGALNLEGDSLTMKEFRAVCFADVAKIKAAAKG